MKKLIFNSFYVCLFSLSFIACGVKGRPEPPLRPQPPPAAPTASSETTKPVTFSTEKVPATPSKTKSSNTKKKNGN